MGAGDGHSEAALRAALASVAASEAPAIVEAAMVDARARAQSALTDAMTQALLEASAAAFAPTPARPPAPAPAPPEAPRPPEPQPEPAPPPPRAGDGWWVYGVVAADGLDAAGLPAGVADGQPELVLGGRLAAVAGRVPLAEFGELPLRESLEDVAWLERVARAHERVLDVVGEHATVVPLRLCTIYETRDAVCEMLVRESGTLSVTLERLRGRSEWGVKAYADPAALARAARHEDDGAEAVQGLGEGGAYLRRRRADAQAGDRADRLAAECVQAAHDRLCEHAEEWQANPVQRRGPSEHPGDLIFNGAYLLERDATDAFHAEVDRLEEEHRRLGVSFELSGPWPPYNFVDLGR